MSDIATNVEAISRKIFQVAERVGRDPQNIRLVAATKYVEPQQLLKAFQAGITIFGENRFQEAQRKMEAIGKQPGLVWHFIGLLQRRKLKDLVGRFDLIHSLGSIDQANELNWRAKECGIQQSVLLEVNVGSESTKGGFPISDLKTAMPILDQFTHIQIQGLMAIPPQTSDSEITRSHFRALKILAEEVKAMNLENINMKELSMGMSQDFTIAIEEGATLIRIGTALFGTRAT